MNILTLLIIVPVITMIGILLAKNQNQTRWVVAVGMGVQLLQSINLVLTFLAERKAGNNAEVLFSKSYGKEKVHQ